MRNEEVQERRRARLADACDRAGGKAALGRLLGYKDGAFVGQMLRGERPVKEETVFKLESKPGFAGWFSASEQRIAQEPASPYRVAQSLSLEKHTVTPQVKWGELMRGVELPEVFEVEAPDDAMAPSVAAGQLVKFDRSVTPRPGKGVLIRDVDGNHYFRVYIAGRAGHWEAHALNDAYRPLESLRDGLTVVAVLTGMTAPPGEGISLA